LSNCYHEIFEIFPSQMILHPFDLLPHIYNQILMNYLNYLFVLILFENLNNLIELYTLLNLIPFLLDHVFDVKIISFDVINIHIYY
jgi:hypothetical protein